MPRAANCFNVGDEVICLRNIESIQRKYLTKGEKFIVSASSNTHVALNGVPGAYSGKYFDYADLTKKPVKMTDCVMDIIKTSDNHTGWQSFLYRIKIFIYKMILWRKENE